MMKKLRDFSVDEIINRAVGGFGEQDTQGYAKFEDERNALKTVLDFTISQQQFRINKKLESLTKWLVILTVFQIGLAGITLIKLIVKN